MNPPKQKTLIIQVHEEVKPTKKKREHGVDTKQKREKRLRPRIRNMQCVCQKKSRVWCFVF